MNRRILVTILGAALVAPAAPCVMAQQDESQAPAGAQAPDQQAGSAQRPNQARMLEMLAKRLSLTDDQKSQIAPILADRRAQIQALRSDPSLRRMQRGREAKKIREESDKKIDAILTMEQRKQYAEMEQEMRDRMRERRSERRQGGPY